MDGYHYGLNGHEVAWAVKKYSGHCGLPCEAVHEVAQEFCQSKLVATDEEYWLLVTCTAMLGHCWYSDEI